jgi:hypothetical protein
LPAAADNLAGNRCHIIELGLALGTLARADDRETRFVDRLPRIGRGTKPRSGNRDIDWFEQTGFDEWRLSGVELLP